jgi:NitT/TauT family transport system ATP-binding protein
MVGLGGFEQAYPAQLSGGMRQRANIIRTMIYEPKVILMDEPFGPLDAQTRVVLQDLLLNLWERAKSTIVFITHDLQEAIGLGDRVVLLSARPGRVARIETVPLPRPRDVFKIHDSPEFRELYDNLWLELERQVRGTHV